MDQPSFRDRPINIDESGKRKWIYARQPKGKWYTRRTVFAWVCIAFLVFAPIIKINGNPLMLLDIANRRFSLLGNMVWAQDTYILALIMSVAVVFVVFFTVAFGRLWCGWACPQTIFLEMIYRRIEYLFDGNYRRTNRKPTKGLRFFFKHLTFLLVSILLTNVFLNWFTGPEKLIEIIKSPISEHRMGFMFMLGISAFYYWIYAFFREQVCTMACPYGRMQGVLLDSKSISVIYDYKRGEPRGTKAEGACINCGSCMAVCPTGIDIKNGSQLECVNCTACIDECNSVMARLNRPGNLIRYDSVHGIETGKRSIKNGRTYAYSVVLLILLIVLSVVVSKRTPVDATILRMSGTIYQRLDTETIANVYNVKVINKTQQSKNLTFRLLNGAEGTVQLASDQAVLKENGTLESVLIIKLPARHLKGKNTPLDVGIYEGETLLKSVKLNFVGPKRN
jgi:cytochrome c oxidase accessory protein FixG